MSGNAKLQTKLNDNTSNERESCIETTSPLQIVKNVYRISTPSVTTSDIDRKNTKFPVIDNDELLLTQINLSQIHEQTIFAEHGYKRLNKICDTLQGALYRGQQISNNRYVAIKKTDKIQFKQRVAVQGGFSFCITENRIKEALILKYLTADNQPIGDYIVKFIDFFESDSDFYLVTEYVESQMNFKQFVQISHQYIVDGRIKLKEYHKMIKYLYWQLLVTIHWLHDDMNCCHLDLCLENILLDNFGFIQGKDGNIMINPAVSIKLGDFGVAELFKIDQSTRCLKMFQPFRCKKQHLSLDHESYLAPKICRDELYDARAADMWSLGLILFECMAGTPLYEPMEAWQSICSSPLSSTVNLLNNGYWALIHGQLYQYLGKINKLRYFSPDSFGLLNNLLNNDENARIDSNSVLKQKWFNLYYQKYRNQIHKKCVSQNRKFIENKAKIKHFPFYKY